MPRLFYIWNSVRTIQAPWKTFTLMFVSKIKCLNWIFMYRFAIHLINIYKEKHLWSA